MNQRHTGRSGQGDSTETAPDLDRQRLRLARVSQEQQASMRGALLLQRVSALRTMAEFFEDE